MTPDGRVGTRCELELRYKSQTMWTKKRLAHRRHKAIEKLDGPTDFKWVRDHPTYVPEKAEANATNNVSPPQEEACDDAEKAAGTR
jgi:hypothetical protein